MTARQIVREAVRPIVILACATFVIAVLIAVFMTRPIQAGTLGYDAAGSVLYFDRILAGRRLEAFLGATPKPLLTAIYGVVHALVSDWRAISWISIAAYAGGIAAITALGFRLGGAIAGAFIAAGLLASSELLQDVDLAYAVSWAMLFWGIAGLLVTNQRPRYAWAGIALALGALARLETVIIVGSAALILLALPVLARRFGAKARHPGAGLILLGFLAVPVQMLHDFALTADPLYSQSVPVLGSIGIESTGLSAVAARVGAHFSPEPALLLLAIVGLGVLLVRRQWAIAIGTAALSAGVLLFLLYLGMRNVYVSGRYVAPVDVAVTFAAGLGAASVLAPGVRFFHEPDRQLVGVHLLVGAIVAVALVRPLGPLDPSQRNEISSNGAVHRDLAQVTPVLQREIAAQGVVPWPTTGSPTKPMGSDAILLAPILTVPQLAVDLDLPLSAILGTTAESIASDGSYPRPGQIVFHDVDRDSPPTAFRVFEVNQTTHIGSITIEPIFVDPRGRFWVLRIR